MRRERNAGHRYGLSPLNCYGPLVMFVTLACLETTLGCNGGGRTRTVYIPSPAPPPIYRTEVITKPVYRPSCFEIARKECEEYDGMCRECLLKCNAAAQEYCNIRRRYGISKRSVPVGPPMAAAEPTSLLDEGVDQLWGLLFKHESTENSRKACPTESIMKILDVNADDQVQLWEVLEVARAHGLVSSSVQLRAVFHNLDADKNGYLSAAEIQHFLSDHSRWKTEEHDTVPWQGHSESNL